jgi:hypothetical protein
MGGFLPGFSNLDVKNELQEKKGLSAYHRHTEEFADGSKMITEASIEHFKNVDIKGDKWLVNQNPCWNGEKDRDDAHSRHDKEFTVQKLTTTFIDKNGLKTIDEKGQRFDDESFSRGTKVISSTPEHEIDKRPDLSRNLFSGQDQFKTIGSGSGFTPLIGNGGFNA